MTPLPRTVPRLTAEMICRERLSGENGTHCLLGWLDHLGLGGSQIEKALRAKCPISSVVHFNNCRYLGDVADLWNRVIATIDFDGQRYELDPAGNQFVLKEGGK